jgi:hypothetical protein
MKIIDRITQLRSNRLHIFEDNVTKRIPYLAVSLFLGMVGYVIIDYFLVIR